VQPLKTEKKYDFPARVYDTECDAGEYIPRYVRRVIVEPTSA